VHNAGATQVLPPGAAASGADTVEMITLDSLALQRCDLVKIDTEGFEDRVIAGGLTTLGTCHPVLYVEVHDRSKLARVAGLLRPLAYALTLHHTRFFRDRNHKGRSENIFPPNAGGSALIAIPPGRILPEGLPGQLAPLG
jgi:hypothetical protein